jgi:hypothetical protein
MCTSVVKEIDVTCGRTVPYSGGHFGRHVKVPVSDAEAAF